MEEEKQSESARPAKKITPLQLREQYHLNIADLAHKAKVGPNAVYYMVMGYPIARQIAEQILATISAETGQTYTLENVQVALTSEEREQDNQTKEAKANEEGNIHIAILAWGSLMWEQRNLALASPWDLSGPEAPLEFSRVSASRNGALTLVIDPAHGVLFPTYIALSAFQTLTEALDNLGEREGGDRNCVGYVNCRSGERHSQVPAPIVNTIYDWAKNRDMDAVMWTDFPSNFETIDKTRFSDVDETTVVFTIEHARRYLHGLRAPGNALARAYINNAPPHIQTPLRQSLASDPWLVDPPISSGEGKHSLEAGRTDGEQRPSQPAD